MPQMNPLSCLFSAVIVLMRVLYIWLTVFVLYEIQLAIYKLCRRFHFTASVKTSINTCLFWPIKAQFKTHKFTELYFKGSHQELDWNASILLLLSMTLSRFNTAVCFMLCPGDPFMWQCSSASNGLHTTLLSFNNSLPYLFIVLKLFWSPHTPFPRPKHSQDTCFCFVMQICGYVFSHSAIQQGTQNHKYTGKKKNSPARDDWKRHSVHSRLHKKILLGLFNIVI